MGLMCGEFYRPARRNSLPKWGKIARLCIQVFVEGCKYLEESKCVGVFIVTCKLPTQTFFKEYMGIPMLFEDYSCQFHFGVPALSPGLDSALKEPCLEICPNAI
ncbi:hypothetical protein MLD38_028120 [Melastoma candidum]|uniref:Uncharacterized protein n=1 Tax=Melastoma candidum TaxID=119954 RepID=A0ACB9MZV8_9MYRT|nr:hypothetical protein MLD38_028120 [Melastoma candidum]